MFIMLGRSLERQITELIDRVRTSTDSKLDKIRSYLDLSEEVNLLREDKNNLIIDKSRLTEQYDKREREIEHKLGLEKLRQQTELELAKREAKLAVGEENLKKDQQRFAEQMKFQTDRMVAETGYLKDMIKPLLEALPKMTIKENIRKR